MFIKVYFLFPCKDIQMVLIIQTFLCSFIHLFFQVKMMMNIIAL